MAGRCEAAPRLCRRHFHFYDALRELALKVEVPPLYCRCQIWYHSLLSQAIKEEASLWHLKLQQIGGERGARAAGCLGWGGFRLFPLAGTLRHVIANRNHSGGSLGKTQTYDMTNEQNDLLSRWRESEMLFQSALSGKTLMETQINYFHAFKMWTLTHI